MKYRTLFYILMILTLILNACSGTAAADSNTQTGDGASDLTPLAAASQEMIAIPVSADFEDDDFASTDVGATTSITLKGDSIDAAGAGVEVNGSSATITAAGSYKISGILNDGQIVVDTQDSENVVLLLAGVDIHNESSASIYVANAEKVIITLSDGTQNNISDGGRYTNLDESGEPNAAIFSHDDLTINGDGALTVTANYNNGIVSKDDLKITGGIITVTAVNDGIKGKDSLSILDGTLTVIAGADGLEATNADESGKGFILIEGGTLNITAALDGIHAETILQINGGTVDITTGGGTVNNSTDGGGIWGGRGTEGNTDKPAESAKGLKAGLAMTISGGIFTINSADDSLHSNGTITIYGGEITLSSGDDGMHADSALTINAGTITITQSYEGLESAVITINNGDVHVMASDDGINAGGGADNSAVGGRPGENAFNTSDGSWVYINGGTIYVNANGDGLDTNGSFEMTGGNVIVDGPINDGNGPLDYMGTFNITGGFLVAVGSSGMAQAPSETSSQYSVMYNFDSQQPTGTMIHIESDSGEEILTYLPAKSYQSVLFSTAELENGETCVIYTGGNASGSITDGLYADSSYTPGTQVASLTISSMVTGGGMLRDMMGGGRPGGGRH
ncbi:MAG: carbohydrate-binding domain-containing protein [Anaerolineales bacterium]|nr:carbohydrate-binding domain-containing protein [Anaerolineales bacterium]